MEKTILLCDDSVNGIFTGVYEAYASKLGHRNIKLDINSVKTLELFYKYINIITDNEKAEKVARTIIERLGRETYEILCEAAASYCDDKADAIYKTIVIGLSTDKGRQVMDCLSNPYVQTVFELRRNVYFERDHLKGFLRFRELNKKVLFAKIAPKNNLLALLSFHFADRFPLENWMIYDEKRKLLSVHMSKKNWIIVNDTQLNMDEVTNYSEEEKIFENLWRGFCDSIAIKERKNLNLQQQNLPLRFRSNMVEFDE